MDDVHEFTSRRTILKSSRSKQKPETPLKHVLSLPKRLKDKIIRKSSKMWKYPFEKTTAKRKLSNKENEDISIKKSRHDESNKITMGQNISMVVIHTDYPRSDLSIPQAELIIKNIKDSMKYAREPYGSQLDIIEMEYKEGILYVTCGNHTTVNWMWETVHSLGDTQNGMLLRVIDSKYFSHNPNLRFDEDNFEITGLTKF